MDDQAGELPMLTRDSVTSAPKTPSFDYSEDEWVRISAVVAKVRGDPLSAIERDALRITAEDYLAGIAEADNAVPRSTERKAWEKVSLQIDGLQRAIDSASAASIANRSGSILEGGKWIVVTEDILTAVLGDSHPVRDVPAMTVCDVRVLLSQIKLQVDMNVSRLRFGPAYAWSYSGRLEPRVPYVQQILWLWTHRFGGKLTLSVDWRVHGLLVDYVAAVAGPVMKDAAPKPSSLRDSIERQKKFYAWLSEFSRKHHGLEIGPLAYNRAVIRRPG
jgi:hypothetical protein